MAQPTTQFEGVVELPNGMKTVFNFLAIARFEEIVLDRNIKLPTIVHEVIGQDEEGNPLTRSKVKVPSVDEVAEPNGMEFVFLFQVGQVRPNARQTVALMQASLSQFHPEITFDEAAMLVQDYGAGWIFKSLGLAAPDQSEDKQPKNAAKPRTRTAKKQAANA